MDPQTDNSRRELMLGRAFLLLKRGQLDAAQRIVAVLPRDADVDDLMARIAHERGRDRTTQERLRGWRYQLHLDTSARRAWAYLVAGGAAVYGAYELAKAAGYAATHGLAAEITTRVERNRQFVDWTRPIYYDLLYGGAFLIVGALAVLLVFRVARGAADWEELNPRTDPDRIGTGGWHWW